MKQMQFTVEINASKEKVWDTLWQDETLRQWAGIIDPGTYMKGELAEGSTVEYISAENGYGVTSLVVKMTPNEFLLLKHQADTQESGHKTRDNEWTGGNESYQLSQKDGITTLTCTFDVPKKMEDYFNEAYPKALQKIKELAEKP